MNVSRFRLITFDVTDTLLKFRSAPAKQYAEVGASYGVICDSQHLSASFKSHFRKMKTEHPNFGKTTGLGWEMWWKQLVIATFKDCNKLTNKDDKKLESIASHLIRLYETSTCWQQSYGALGLLSYLRNRRIPLGIISNFDPRLDVTLANTRLRHYFNFIVTSYEVSLEKPSSEIFHKAMELSNIDNLKAEECLHVGNTALLDYVGATQSGWNAVLIHDLEPHEIVKKYPNVDPNHVFPNLYDLHKHLLENASTKQSSTNLH